MEFYNVKLLPKGLPEIIAQLVPYEIYPDTKVITYPRKEKRGLLGRAGSDGLTQSYYIKLYPTVLSAWAEKGSGTYSFRFWLRYLKTALHEVGHLATYCLTIDLPYRSDSDDPYLNSTYLYAEALADDWASLAMARILAVDPRLGQPPGALTGYPGMEAYTLRNSGRPWNNGTYDYGRQAEWRGLSCGGQVLINDIAEKLMLQEHPGYEVPPESWQKAKARYRRAVHKAAKELGIERYFTNKNGRRYLMFNVGEAEAVYEWLLNNGAKLIDSNWNLVSIDTPAKVPQEQLRLPF